jgi:hypothetical protein
VTQPSTGAKNSGALEIDPSLMQVGRGLLDFRAGDRRVALVELQLFQRDGVELGETLPALRLARDVLPVKNRLLQHGFAAADGYLVIGGVDNHQEVALAHKLIVGNFQFHDAPGNLRGHGHDVSAHRGVASPRRFNIGSPHTLADRGGDGDARQGDEHRDNPAPDGPAGTRNFECRCPGMVRAGVARMAPEHVRSAISRASLLL